MSLYDFEAAKKILAARLSPARYQHSLGVSQTAAELAQIYGQDCEKSAFAGLVHDITKNVDQTQQYGLLARFGVPITPPLQYSPAVLHSITGAYLARAQFDIDEQMFRAILYHTTGHRGMGRFEMILFVADLIEPSRVFPDVEILREKAKTNIDAVALEKVRFSILCNVKKGLYLHPDTLDLYNEFSEKRYSK